jgi:ABC-type Fe3+-siderophore transport system permease subunit
MKIKISFLLTAFILFINSVFAQTENNDVNAKNFSNDTSVGNFLKTDNKIYTVIVVISIILIGLFLYLYKMDQKINKLKK